MTAQTGTRRTPWIPGGAAGQLAAVAERAMGRRLPVGLRAWDGSHAGPTTGPVLVLNSPEALRRLLWHPGELGLAQAYVTGELDVEGDLRNGLKQVRAGDDGGTAPSLRALAGALPEAIRALHRTGVLGGLIGMPPEPPRSQARLRGRLHSGVRDKAAIAHHYDLSNEFYALVLDEHMAYSSAYFTSDDDNYTLADAQADKLSMVCRKLGLEPGMRLLDVGCGWGSLSIYAAQHFGVRVTGITLSAQQATFARERIARLGLGDRVEIRLQDYRELTPDGSSSGQSSGQSSGRSSGLYDAVGSLEMGEHVGEDNYPVYASTLHRMVRPQGRVLVQQMSRGLGEAGRNRHPGGGAFIEAYIAPDMHMRPVGETVGFLERAGLEVRDVHAMREHYVRTVDVWYETFERRWDDAVALVGEEVARVWRLYLVGGGLAFEEGRMGVDQILAVKPAGRGRSGMPALRTA